MISDNEVLARHHGSPSLVSDDFICYLWWTEWYWVWFISGYCSPVFHMYCTITLCMLTNGSVFK